MKVMYLVSRYFGGKVRDFKLKPRQGTCITQHISSIDKVNLHTTVCLNEIVGQTLSSNQTANIYIFKC